jgi:hypothetical protein
MKSKLLKLTVAALMVFNIKTQAQVSPATLGSPIIVSGFDTWTGATPNGWMAAPATTIPASGVSETVTTNTVYPVYGAAACNLINTGTSYTTGVIATSSVSVTSGMAYEISYYARGKGTINIGVTDGSGTYANYAIAQGQAVSGANWHKNYQTVIAPTTTNNAQFFLEVKKTTSYSTTTTPVFSITGIDVDSFVVAPYTPTVSTSLYDIQYTTSSSGNSPFNGQFVGQTGGIVTCIALSSTGPSGYYVQTTGATSWAACYVYDDVNAPALGDSITFGAAVTEYFNMTEMQQVSNWNIVSTGNPVPHSLNITTQTIAQEMLESMLVNWQGATVNTYSTNYGQGTATDASGVPGTFDFKSNFYPPNGTATTGSTGNPGYAPIVGNTYCITGVVNYEFSVYNMMPRDSADIVNNCSALGIQKYNSSLHANVYPNPMNNQLMIQLPTESTKVNVSFTDVLGKEVIAFSNLSGSQIAINDISLPAGVYMVKITADGNTQMTKVVKQ